MPGICWVGQAWRLDPEDRVRTACFFLGVTVIALSQIILSLQQPADAAAQ